MPTKICTRRDISRLVQGLYFYQIFCEMVLGVEGQNTRTILPVVEPDSINWWAFAASANGNS